MMGAILGTRATGFLTPVQINLCLQYNRGKLEVGLVLYLTM